MLFRSVFPDDLIDQQPEAVQAYVTTIIEAGKYIEASPLDASTHASPFMLDLAPEVIVQAIENPAHRSSYEDLLPKKSEFEEFQEYMITLGLIPDEIDLDAFVNDSFAQKAERSL